MASAKKAVKKKPAATKTVQKSTTKPKKTTPKKSVSTAKISTKKAVSASANSFWQVKFTINTVYWLIIGVAVISTAIITYNTHVQLNDLYDAIDAENLRSEEVY